MSAALAAIDYAIQLAEAADQKFHDAFGRIDEFLHAQVAKLKALRERVASAAGVFSSRSEDVYGSLSEAGKREVDEQFSAIAAATRTVE